jgi:hypothetical protein
MIVSQNRFSLSRIMPDPFSIGKCGTNPSGRPCGHILTDSCGAMLRMDITDMLAKADMLKLYSSPSLAVISMPKPERPT